MGEPVNSCMMYFVGRLIEDPVEVSREVFDELFAEKKFSDGPFREGFGDGYGEPYNPHRQAYGTLNDGRGVYCELRKD